MRTERLGVFGVAALLSGACFLSGCMSYGPPPPTVAYVDIERYMGLWHEIASNPVFFNEDLVGVTAEYTLRDDGTVRVVNRGHVGTLDGPEESIEGTARVVDTETNSKLAVSFFPLLGRLTEGKYWIVVLDDENYQYAAVTDNRQNTLFILYREPAMPRELYEDMVARLEAIEVDISRLRVTGEITQ